MKNDGALLVFRRLQPQGKAEGIGAVKDARALADVLGAGEAVVAVLDLGRVALQHVGDDRVTGDSRIDRGL